MLGAEATDVRDRATLIADNAAALFFSSALRKDEFSQTMQFGVVGPLIGDFSLLFATGRNVVAARHRIPRSERLRAGRSR